MVESNDGWFPSPVSDRTQFDAKQNKTMFITDNFMFKLMTIYYQYVVQKRSRPILLSLRIENCERVSIRVLHSHCQIQGVGAPGTRPPRSKFFHFHAVFGKKSKKSQFGSLRPLRKILDQPLIAPSVNPVDNAHT